MLAISGTASAAGGVVKAQGEAASLEYQSDIAMNEARFANIQAEDAALRGAQRALRLRNLASKELSENISATAASGIAVESGTAAEVSESVKLIGAADVLESQRNTKREVWGFRTKAIQKASEAKQAKRAAKTTRLLSPFAGIAPILGTFGQIGAISAAGNTGGQQ
jgi:hypothetical protein